MLLINAINPKLRERSNMRELIILWSCFLHGFALDMKFYDGVGATGVCIGVQGSTIRPFPSCKNAAGKLRLKW